MYRIWATFDKSQPVYYFRYSGAHTFFDHSNLSYPCCNCLGKPGEISLLFNGRSSHLYWETKLYYLSSFPRNNLVVNEINKKLITQFARFSIAVSRLRSFITLFVKIKIKGAALHQDQQKGGICMVGIEILFKVLRLSWIPSLRNIIHGI